MVISNSSITFNNTEVAFAYKTKKELKEAYRLFFLMQYAGLVQLASKLIPLAIKAGLPVMGLIRRTIFKHFVGGETLPQTAVVAKKLALSGVQVILDYGVEGKEGEAAFDYTCNEFIKVIRYAATQPNIPYISVKVTGFARFSLLQKIDAAMDIARSASLIGRYQTALQQLTAVEINEWEKVYERMQKICAFASQQKIGVWIDAEESWIQDPVDALSLLMMQEYNKSAAIVFNTVQLYRHDRLDFLYKMYQASNEQSFILGVKLVRGAYMEKERKRAKKKRYPSPIQKDKVATDNDYNTAVKFCINHIENISLIVATHNEYSSLLATELLQLKALPLHHPHIHFSQLYGMSDHITFNLAKAGCSVSKYTPFGLIKDVVPYLIRRAQENTSVKGQTNRELTLIKDELNRRKLNEKR